MVDLTTPVVSVIMITYLHESFIAEAIKGVLMQQCDFDVELIIADDCSPDNTKAVVESFKNHPNYRWIKYICHEKNKGMMDNFIWAISQAKGEFIALCEGDDYWIDTLKLKKQVNIIAENVNVGLVYTNFLYLKGKEFTKHSFTHGSFSNLEQYFLENIPFLYTGSWLINKKYLENLTLFHKNPDLPGDAQLACEILQNGGQIVHLAEDTGVYRVLSESASHSKTMDKDIVFLQLKYLLLKKYKTKISSTTAKKVIKNLVYKQFHNFQYLRLDFVERVMLITPTIKLKGIGRTLKYILKNKS